MVNVIKRDGREVPFDSNKIKVAIIKAFYSTDGKIAEYAESKAENIANYIEGYCEDEKEPLSIEEIQDLVENGLMSTKRKDVAKAYIKYREKRTKERNWNTQMMRVAREKLAGNNIENQNANVDEHSFGGRRGEFNSIISKQYALDNCMSKMARENHLNNEIYIHDLDTYAVGMHNCLSIPFDDLLANGFNTRQSDIRPANSINTAFQLVAVLFQLQSLQQFGGVSATHLDWTMVPYVRKSFYKHFKDACKYIHEKPKEAFCLNGPSYEEGSAPIDSYMYTFFPIRYGYAMDMTQKELVQAVEGMYHNLNTLQSRSGNQLPFTSINYGTCTLPEGRMVIKALLEGSIKGVGKFHKTPIFPCGIFQVMKGVNKEPGTPNYDLYRLALESTAKRLYPNYANCDVKMQKDWINYDRKQKEEYINSLTEEQYNILITRLEENPELQNILMLEIYEEDA